MPPDPLAILLISGGHERAQYAFVVASAAASLGRAVTLFATNEGCRALLDDWSGIEDAGRDAAMRLRGVAGIGELRDAARELGVCMIACEAGLRATAIAPDGLAAGVEVGGIATFLEAARGGQIVTL